MRNVPRLLGTLTPPQPQPAYVMNTRGMKSSLQAEFKDILSPDALAATAPRPPPEALFPRRGRESRWTSSPVCWTAQSPRLELHASGGTAAPRSPAPCRLRPTDPSSAVPLLTDRVKAVPPGRPRRATVVDRGHRFDRRRRRSFRDRYPALDHAHVIAGHTGSTTFCRRTGSMPSRCRWDAWGSSTRWCSKCFPSRDRRW